MKDKILAVKEFHKAFKLDYLNEPKGDIGLDKNLLRFNLMKEENEEYLEAANNNDIVEVADALGDMLYILCVMHPGWFLRRFWPDLISPRRKFIKILFSIATACLSIYTNNSKMNFRTALF